MDCDDHSRCYLIGIIEAVIHKPGDKWSFAHCGGREKQWNYTVNASQNLVCSLHRQHVWCSCRKHHVMLSRRGYTGLQESELWLLLYRCVGNMGVAVLLSQQHTVSIQAETCSDSFTTARCTFLRPMQPLWQENVEVTWWCGSQTSLMCFMISWSWLSQPAS